MLAYKFKKTSFPIWINFNFIYKTEIIELKIFYILLNKVIGFIS